jgi:hypothetical protein
LMVVQMGAKRVTLMAALLALATVVQKGSSKANSRAAAKAAQMESPLGGAWAAQ